VAGAIALWNLPALRVASKVGYKEVARLRNFDYVILMIPFTLKGEFMYIFLHAICSKLPETFLHHIITLPMSVVGLIRRRLSVG